MILLNPGPVTLTERVRKSLLQPDLCHRENEFFALSTDFGDANLAAVAATANKRLSRSRTNAIHRSRRQCMLIMLWLKPCGSSLTKGAEPPVMRGTQRGLSRFGRRKRGSLSMPGRGICPKRCFGSPPWDGSFLPTSTGC